MNTETRKLIFEIASLGATLFGVYYLYKGDKISAILMFVLANSLSSGSK